MVAIGEDCNYLVCASDAMDKLKVIATMKKIILVDDQWLIDWIASGLLPQIAGTEPAKVVATKPTPIVPIKAAVVKAAAVNKAAAGKAAAKSSGGSGNSSLDGMTFSITGKFAV
jgi:hypothetical protein